MSNQPLFGLRDGNTIPQLGLGVFQTPPDITASVVKTALASGYRHIDTAAVYVNEIGVGEGLRASELPREQVFVTTKLWNADQGFDAALKAFEHSVKRLGLDYLDLYLIHWPSPRRDLYVDSWRALVRLKEEGRVRSIGVSNFGADHLRRIIDETGVTPVLNQVELHPHFQQRALTETHKSLGIATESWSPLGQGKELKDPVIGAIAARLGKTPAQVIIRWHLERGLIVIPKSVTASRIAENLDVQGFSLSAADLEAIAGLDSPDGRIGPDPATASF
ncbi:MAG TPA: aldo/keto reductase [Steroidobacteraceae bacterium]|nr:aldo/keto reductase [Steroidobacteraceae bacterium]